MDNLEVLRRSDIFSELDDKELGIVAEASSSQVFEAGAIVCKQGKKETHLYVIEDGLVGIILEVGPMAQRQVQAASNYQSFGWSCMIEPNISTATATAREKTRAIVFSAEDLQKLFAAYPEIGLKITRGIARVVATRLRQAYVQLLGVSLEDVSSH